MDDKIGIEPIIGFAERFPIHCNYRITRYQYWDFSSSPCD